METKTISIRGKYESDGKFGKQYKILSTEGIYYTSKKPINAEQGQKVSVKYELTKNPKYMTLKELTIMANTSSKTPQQGGGQARPESNPIPHNDGLATEKAFEKYDKIARRKYPDVSNEALCNITAALLNYERARHWFDMDKERRERI